MDIEVFEDYIKSPTRNLREYALFLAHKFLSQNYLVEVMESTENLIYLCNKMYFDLKNSSNMNF